MAIASEFYDPPAEKASVLLLFVSITVLTLTYVCYELLKGLKSGKPVERLNRIASEYQRTLFAFDQGIKGIPPLASLAKKLPSSAALAAKSPKTLKKKAEPALVVQEQKPPQNRHQSPSIFNKGVEWAFGTIDATWEFAVDTTAFTINKTMIRPAKWTTKGLGRLAQKSPLTLFVSNK